MSIEDKKEFDEDIEPVLSLDKHLGLDYAEYSSIMNKLKKLEKQSLTIKRNRVRITLMVLTRFSM